MARKRKPRSLSNKAGGPLARRTDAQNRQGQPYQGLGITRRTEMEESARKNPGLANRNIAANKMLKDRYGINYAQSQRDLDLGEGAAFQSTARQREFIIANLNDRLSISGETADPTRKVTDAGKRISQAFMSLDSYASGVTDEIDNTVVRGEVARIRELAQHAGNTELEAQAQVYLEKYSKNTKFDARSLGGSLNAIRELQNSIRDSYNVDYLFGQAGGSFEAALSKGTRVSEKTQELYQYKTAQQAQKERDKRYEAQVDYVEGYDGPSFRQPSAPTRQPDVDHTEYQTDLPWWATLND